MNEHGRDGHATTDDKDRPLGLRLVNWAAAATVNAFLTLGSCDVPDAV